MVQYHIGNGACYAEANIEECGYDGGDCCLAETECKHYCQGLECTCHETGLVHCEYHEGACEGGGNQICDAENNDIYCDFDDGDCCLKTNTICDLSTCFNDACECHLEHKTQCPGNIKIGRTLISFLS